MPTMAEQMGLQPVSMAQAAGLMPVQVDPDSPENQALIARRQREAQASARFKQDVTEDTQPGMMARMGRGAEDFYQGATQRILQGLDTLPREKLSIEELRAGASPDEQKLSDEELRKKFEQQSLSKNYTQDVNDEVALYDKGREGQGRDYLRMIGAGAAAAPAGVIGAGRSAVASTLGKILTRAKMGAIGGAAAGATEFTPSNKVSDTAVNTAVGAGTGAVVGPVAGAAGDAAAAASKWIKGRIAGLRAPELTEPKVIKAVPEAAGLPPAQRADLIAEAQEQIRTTGQLDPESLSRKANLIAQGVTPTKSMVTRDPADWTRERNLQKLSQSPDQDLSNTGQELTSVYQKNDKALAGKLTGMSQNLPPGNAEAQGMTVMQGLGDLAKASQQDVSKVYNDIRATHGEELASDARNVIGTLQNPDIADNAYAEPIINSVTKRLKRFGMVDGEGNPTTKSMTVTQADEFRKFLQGLKSGDPKTDRIVGEFIKSTDADVTSGFGSDVMSPARTAARERFEMLSNPATQKALNTLDELNQGKTAQNFIKSQVISASEQDVGTLVDTLGKIADPAKRAQTQNALKAGVLQHLQDEAINPKSGKFSGSALDDAIRDIGDTKGVKIFGDEWTKLKNLARAGVDATYEPPYSAVNHSNTAPMLLSLIRGARTLPGVPLIVTENAEKLAAQSGARSQLSNILKAQAPGPEVSAPPAMQEIARLLSQSSAPIAAGLNPALNNRRQPSNR